MWLWAKYVTAFSQAYHCTHCIKGKYSRRFSKTSNLLLAEQNIICFDEIEKFKAIYICGVSKRGYGKKLNYLHNVHLAIKPSSGQVDRFNFENWVVSIENGVILPIPDEESLPEKYKGFPSEYTTCRIFRWAACYFIDQKVF